MRNSVEHPTHPAAGRGTAYPFVVSGVLERNPGVDDTLGGVFREMRRALRLTEGEMALRLGTTPRVIADLEAGRLRALPPWPETTRIVSLLGRMLSVDPRPILQRMSRQMGVEVAMPAAEPPSLVQRLDKAAAAQSPRQRAVTALPVQQQSADASRAATRGQPVTKGRTAAVPTEEGPKIRRSAGKGRRRGKVLLAVAMPMVVIASGVWVVQKQPRALHASINLLPRTIAQPIRSSLDSLTLTLAPRREGLRWVEVDDPRTRKADKLRTVVR